MVAKRPPNRPKSEPAAEEAAPTPQPEAAESAPAETAAAPPAKKGKAGSIADMLAMARSEGAPGSAKAEAKPKPKPKAKPAAKAAPKAAAKPEAGAKADWESPSILTGGARADQPRPLSKAEAAAKTQDAPAAKGKPKKVAPPMPQKPAYAKPTGKGKKADVDESRRGFLSVMLGTALGVGFTAMATTFGLWGLALARFMFPNRVARAAQSVQGGLSYRLFLWNGRDQIQGTVWCLDCELRVQRCLAVVRVEYGLHAFGLHAELAGRRTEIQVPLPRQRFLQRRNQL